VRSEPDSDLERAPHSFQRRLALLKSAFSTAWDWTVKGFEWFAKNIIPLYVKVWKTEWQWLVKGLTWFVDTVSPWIKTGFTSTWNWTVSGLTWIANSVFPYIRSAFSTAWKFAVSGLEEFAKISKWLGATILTLWNWTVSGVEWIQKASYWFGGTVSSTWKWVSSGLSDIIKTVNQYATKPLKTVWSWTVKGMDFVKDIISDPDKIKKAWNDLSAWFGTNVWNKITNAASAATSSIAKVWNGLVDIMKSAGKGIVSAIVYPLNLAIKGINTMIDGINLLPQAWFGARIPHIPEIGVGPEKKAEGGMILGPGGPTEDKILAALSNGEYVIPAWMVRKYYALIQSLEAIRRRGYATGGPVSTPITPASFVPQTQPDYLGDMQDELNKMAEFLKGVLNPIFAKLGLNINLTGDNLDALEGQLNDAANKLNNLGNSADNASKILDKFAPINDALAQNSEMFKVNKQGGLELAGVLKGIATGDWVSALISFGTKLVSALASLKSVSAVLNPFSTIVKGMVDGFSWLDKALSPLAKALYGFGKSFGRLFMILMPPIQSFASLLAFTLNTLSWVFDQFMLGVNMVLSWFGMGFLTQDQIKEMQKTPDQRTKESMSSDTSTTTSGNTYSAGSTQPIYNNFTIVFKDNEILSDDSPAVSHLADLFIQYVKTHGGVAVFS
jgi:hypothetical protein